MNEPDIEEAITPSDSLPALADKTLTNQTLALPPGRTLGYATYGSPTGPALFYFYGLPGSRIEGAELHPAAVKLGIRIIAMDRPGLGLSSCVPNRLVADWAADVDQLTQHLQLKTYRVIGRSGGGAYALACANALPRERVLGVGVVCGMAPWSIGTPGMAWYARVLWNISAWAPTLVGRLVGWMVADLAQDPDPTVLMKKLVKNSGGYKGQDKAFMQRKDIQEIFVRSIRESWRQGNEGATEEIRLITAPWGFDLKDVRFKGVQFWYGSEDVNTPAVLGWRMSEQLDGAEMRVCEGDSHLTVMANRMEEILGVMMKCS
ncbi:hypothetical protein MMC18_001132 [Xylographa bjoerkii]|nr:hypothetical protein [Xylographa bjoerkii]